MFSFVETKLFTRIIYFLRTRHGQIWMLTLYAKNAAENISTRFLKQIKDEIDG